MIKTTQKIITIGSSSGVTLPAKELKRQGLKVGDEVDITIRKRPTVTTEDSEVIAAARKILKSYHQDFKNLSQRWKRSICNSC